MNDPPSEQYKSRWAFRGPSGLSTTTTNGNKSRNNESSDELTMKFQEKSTNNISNGSNLQLPKNGQANDSVSSSNCQQTKYKNMQPDLNRYYHGIHPKYLKTSSWQCFWTIFNSFALMVSLIFQGSLLNYYLIYFNNGRSEWYFLFFTDFVILIIFVFSITFAWRFYQRHKKTLKLTDSKSNGFLDVQTAITADHVRFGSGFFRFSFPKPMGMLPLLYICWLIYALNLIVKMYILYSMNMPDSMVKENFFAPRQIILITLAVSVAVFLFWVEAHWNLGDERHRHLSKPSVDDLISHTALEIFDSLAFLDLVTPDDMKELDGDKIYISYAMRMTVLTFASVNFILPTLGLYRLSRTHFGEKTYGMIRIVNETTGKPSARGLGVSIAYHLLRLLAVNMPYLFIRIILASQEARKDLSVFIIKNILGITLSIRNLVPEIKLWLKITKVKAKLRSEITNENGSNDRIRIKIDPSGKFDPISQAWELPTIFEAKQMQTSNPSTNANLGHNNNNNNRQFNVSSFSHESSVDEIEEMDTATTNSSPSINLNSSPSKRRISNDGKVT